MKLLIALALFSVAFADEIRVVSLPNVPSPIFSRADMGHVSIPNYVIDDAVKVAMPVMRKADHEGLQVHFADAPLDIAASDSVIVETPRVAAVTEPVKLGEAPLPAFETADNVDRPSFVAVEPVRIAEPKLPEVVAPIAREIIPEPVQIAEAPLPAFETAESVDSVKFVDTPLDIAAPEPVRLPEAPLPAYETAEAVKIAVPQFDYRGKVFDNPMLR